MMLVLLNEHSRQFTNLFLSRGLYKISVRTGLDLGKKISKKMLSVSMQKVGFRLYEIEFLKKQATSPLRDWLNLKAGFSPSKTFLFICFYKSPLNLVR